MIENQTKSLSEEVENKIYTKFVQLSVLDKLVVYAKITHGNLFRVEDNDISGLNKRSVDKIYKSFICSLKEEFNVVKKSNKTRHKS
jgi:hypothetical protein